MKILHLSYSDLEGGASIAAFRLHRGLRAAGVESRMLVLKKNSDDPDVLCPFPPARKLGFRLKHELAQALLGRGAQSEGGFRSLGLFGSGLAPLIEDLKPDILHLHWVNNEFVSPADLPRFSTPLVWTFHDMWPFAGAEHYCSSEKYVEGHPRGGGLEGWTWRRKRHAYREAAFTAVCPSRWLAECAGRSALLAGSDIRHIPNGIDLSVFRPIEKAAARGLLGLPAEEKLILFGALSATSDRRKGYHLLMDALTGLAARGIRASCLVFGASGPPAGGPEPALPLRYLGVLRDELSLALAYSAADVFAAPSMQDNLPNTAVEALACGTPVAAFRIGGLGDIVDHRSSGWLAEPFDPAALAEGLAWILNGADGIPLAANARRAAEERFNLSVVSRRFIALYRELAGTC